MKNILHYWKLACCTAASVLIVSCGNGADYRNILPADSFVTMSVNPASLSKKSGAGDIAQNPLFIRLKAEIDKEESLSAEEKKYLLTLLKNPEESGIDTKNDLFFFMSMAGANPLEPMMKGGLLLPIGDKAKFDALVARVSEKTGTKPVTADGLSIFNISQGRSESVAFAYNDVALLAFCAQMSPEAVNETVKRLFAQKQSESLMGNQAVAEPLSRQNDINMVISYAGMTSVMNNPMLSAMPMIDALKGAMMVCSTNFEKGQIVSDAAFAFKDKESERKMKDFYAYVKPQTGALLQYVPANCIGTVAYGLNGEKFYSVLSSIPGYGMLMANPLVKQVMDAFDGDFVISFSGMTADGQYPVASLLAQVKDAAVLETAVANMAGMPVQKISDGAYVLNMGPVAVQFGVKDKVLYVTTDAAVKAAIDGSKLESLTSMSKIFKNQSGTLYLDFKALNTLIFRLVGADVTPQIGVAFSVLGMFDDMQAYGDMDGGKVIVNMTDKQQNAFKTICDKTGELIRQFAPEVGL